MGARIALRHRGVYRFDEGIASLYRGAYLVAEPTLQGYALYRRGAWAEPPGDPHLVVDRRGRILARGHWTGYTAEALVDTGASMPAAGDRPRLEDVARHAGRARPTA
jgi:hypothetical protein